MKLLLISLFIFCVHGQNNDNSCPAENGQPFRLVCYVALWYESKLWNGLNIENLDPFLCTQIIAGYGEIKFNLEEYHLDIHFINDERNKFLQEIMDLRKIYPKGDYLISIGGWDDWGRVDKYCDIFENLGEIFITKVIETVQKVRADGIEFAWNFPGRERDDAGKLTDVTCLTDMTQYLCTEMTRHGLICMMTLKGLESFPTNHENYQDYLGNITDILKHAHYINIWAMDLFVQDKIFSNDFLRPPNLQNSTYDTLTAVNVNGVVEFYKKLSQGSPKILEKINMLIGMQNRVYGILPENFDLTKTLGVPDQHDGRNPFEGQDARWQFPYFMVCSRLEGQSGEVLRLYEYKELGDLAFAYNFHFKEGANGLIIPIPTVKSVQEKVKFAKESGLGGVMVFQIGADDVGGFCYNETFPLLNAIKRQIDGC